MSSVGVGSPPLIKEVSYVSELVQFLCREKAQANQIYFSCDDWVSFRKTADIFLGTESGGCRNDQPHFSKKSGAGRMAGRGIYSPGGQENKDG